MKRLLCKLRNFLSRFPLDYRTAGKCMPAKKQQPCNCYREHEIELVYDPVHDEVIRLEPNNGLLTLRVGLDENGERRVITKEYYEELKAHNDVIGKWHVEQLLGKYQTV